MSRAIQASKPDSEGMITLRKGDAEIVVSAEVLELRKALNPQQLAFADHVSFGGERQSRAYQLAYGLEPSASVRSMAAQLMAHKVISRLIELQLQPIAGLQLLTATGKRQRLAEMVDVGAEIWNEDGSDIRPEFMHLVQARKPIFDKEGVRIGWDIKLVDRLKALQIDNKLSGDEAPKRHEHSIAVLLASVPKRTEPMSKVAKGRVLEGAS